MQYTEEQRIAINRSMTENITLVTGGPGTGKTTVIRAIVEENERLGADVLVLAPTGKAASRVTEHTGVPAKTIHRALEWFPPIQGFRRNAANPFDAELIVVDECSMLDSHICAAFLDAVPDDARLVLVGDANQLQPVGPGSPFIDLLADERLSPVRLSVPFRQAGSSDIANAAYAILEGKMPKNSAGFGGSSFFYLERNSGDVEETVMELVKNRLAKFGFVGDGHVQVLVPAKDKPIGTKRMNDVLCKHFNPHGNPRLISTGDKVIQLSNNYDHGVFNGDTGRVIRSSRNAAVVAYSDDREVVYNGSDRNEIARAWALTVHKSQGSEYECAIIALDDSHGPLLHRNLLYTAVTRAKQAAIVVGTRTSMTACLGNVTPKRQTALSHLLSQELAKKPAV